MAKDDKLIEDFFQEMKEEDRKLMIPAAPSTYRKRRNWLLYVAAASVILVISAYLLVTKSNDKQLPQIEVTLSAAPENTTESLITPSQSIDTWESPTQSLINDF